VIAYNVHGDSFPSNVATVTTVAALAPVADAYVRDGTYANTNFGADASLAIKTSTTPDFTRHSYLRFNIGALASITAAKLQMFGGLNQTGSMSVSLYDVSDQTWGEGTITWNNKPASNGAALATVNITSTVAQLYEWDLTAYLQQARAAGKTSVTLLVRSDTGGTDANLSFNSDEAVANRPQLRVTG
jgi:hypothetical protein